MSSASNPPVGAIAGTPATPRSLISGAIEILERIWCHPANSHRRFRAADSTSTSAALYFSGYPGYWEIKFLRAYLRPGDNFLDIGAHTERLRQANPPVWLWELAGYSTCYGVSSDEVVRRLAKAGFDCAVFNPDSGTLEYTCEPWVLGVQNVLAIASAHRRFVEQRLRQSLHPQP